MYNNNNNNNVNNNTTNKIIIIIIIAALLKRLYPCKFELKCATNKIIWRNHKRGRQKSSLMYGTADNMVEKQFQTSIFDFVLRKLYNDNQHVNVFKTQ